MTTIPNMLSLLRLALAPVLLILAWKGQTGWFVAVLIPTLMTDALDGYIARRFHLASALGSKLDTIGDVVIYFTIGLSAWWLYPELVRREALFIGIILLSVVVPGIVGWIKFRATSSYHTWLVKIAVICTVVSVIILFLGGSIWPLRISAGLCVLAALGEILITIVLKEPRRDVGSLWRVWRMDLND